MKLCCGSIVENLSSFSRQVGLEHLKLIQFLLTAASYFDFNRTKGLLNIDFTNLVDFRWFHWKFRLIPLEVSDGTLSICDLRLLVNLLSDSLGC